MRALAVCGKCGSLAKLPNPLRLRCVKFDEDYCGADDDRRAEVPKVCPHAAEHIEAFQPKD